MTAALKSILVTCIAWMAIAPIAPIAIADDGLVKLESIYDVAETGDRFEDLLQQRQITVFSRIDHASGAKSVDLELRPTQVIIFGNPKVGTPLMQCNQTVAIDLPQKAAIWQDAAGKVWLAYNDLEYLATRHDLQGCEEAIAKIGNVLMNLAKTATSP